MALWSGVERWRANHFTGFDRREKWGYGVWFFFSALVLTAEFWAAFGSDSAPFPTISGTTAALEYDYPILGLAVVALIVFCAYSSFRFPKSRTGVTPPPGEPDQGWFGEDSLVPYRTPLGGRFTRSTTPVREFPVVLYIAGAIVVILAGTAWAWITSGGLDEHRTGRTLYGLMIVFLILVPTALAWPKRFALDVPFPTFFSTVRSLERRVRILAYAFAAGLVMLLLHIVLYPWPSVIPDLQRLHRNYECHPLDPVKNPLSAKERAECARRDEKAMRPAADDP
jgi:hypothetical protein